MWIARLEVDTQTAHERGISDCYSWHKKLWECFPDTPNATRDFLTRIDQLEGAFLLWILAKKKPTRPQWCSPVGFSVKEIASSFLSHRYYAFDLRANPTKRIVQRDANGVRNRNGKRVPLIKHDELRFWLERKGNDGGFVVHTDKPLEISPMTESYFRKNGYIAYHGGVRFRGILQVTDTVQFIETYKTGIGSAKSFGFGLLLLAPVKI